MSHMDNLNFTNSLHKFSSVNFLKRSILTLAALICTCNLFAYTGTVVDESGHAMGGVTVILRNDSIVVFNGQTDYDGNFNTFGNPSGMSLFFRMIGYEPETITPEYGGDIGTVTMIRETVALTEVSVVANNKTSKYDYDAYRLSRRQLERHSNMYDALAEIPLVTLGDVIRVRGEEGVLLLVNGVKVDPAEFKAISKQDVKEIRVYDVPPLRFSQEEDVKNVIELVTKDGVTGGNTFLNLYETPYPWARFSNSVRSFFNYGRNRFSLSYGQQFNRSDKSRNDETIAYHTAGGDLEKTSTGLEGYNRNNEHEFSASYMYSNPFARNPLQFNIGFNGRLTDTDTRSLAAVTYPAEGQHQRILSNTGESSDIDRFGVDVYFHRTFGPRHFLIANLVATTHRTSVFSSYKEFPELLLTGEEASEQDAGEFTFVNHNDNRLYSLISEVDYQLSGLGPGKFETAGRYYLQRTRYRGETAVSNLLRNEGMLTVSYRMWIKRLFLRGKLSGTYTNLYSDGDRRRESTLRFTPQIQAYWPINDRVVLSALYSRTTVSPTAGQLTTQTRAVDKGYFITGNPDLRTYASNYFNMAQSLTTRYFEYSINASYTLAPGMIIPAYFGYDDYVMESLVNSRSVNMLLGSLTLSVRPLTGFTIGCNFMGGANIVKTGDQTWHIPTYRCNAWIKYSARKFSVSAGYQAPGHDGIGFLKRKRMQSYNIGGAYKPNPDMEIGLNLSDLFHTPVEERWSVPEALVDFHHTYRAGSFRNNVSVYFSWNISYGRRRIQDNRNISDADEDSGLLSN